MFKIRIMMSVLLMAGALLCTAALPVRAAEEAPSGVLTFDQFYQKVFAYYPKLKAVHGDVEIALAEQMKASAGFWPSLSLSAGMTETDDPVNVFGMLMRQDRFTSGDFELNRLNTPRHQRDLQGGVHIRWPLFDAMQTVHRVRASREKIKASEQDEAFTKMEVFLLAHDAFTSAIAMERMSRAAETSARMAQEDLKKAEDLKDKGMILGADFYGAKVRAGQFLQMKNEWSRQVKAMRMLLNIMMGEPLASDIRLPALLPETDFAEVSLDGLVQTALVDRPDLKAAALRVKAMQEELKRVQDDALPMVVVTADGTNNRHDLGDRGGNNAGAGIRAELPLFDPARKGRVAGAKAALMRAKEEEATLKNNVLKDIATELARFEAMRANYPVLLAMSEDAAKAVEMLLPLYNEGRKSIIDLENAREAHVAALSAFEQMKAGLFSSEARLFLLGGKMDAEGMKALSVKVGGL